MKNLVVLTGAGISAESGIATFRDANGLWEGYDVMEVATPEGWHKNPALVLEFYNQRRKQAEKVLPNDGHLTLVQLEKYFNVTIITQNVDGLHEKAGSSKVIHLHGELSKSRSTANPNLVYEVKNGEILIGDKCEQGSQLRPNIVWFGEMVPLMEKATKIVEKADILLIVGTSLVVYPAAGLVDYAPYNCPIYVVDPKLPNIPAKNNLHLIEAKATIGLPAIMKELVKLR